MIKRITTTATTNCLAAHLTRLSTGEFNVYLNRKYLMIRCLFVLSIFSYENFTENVFEGKLILTKE